MSGAGANATGVYALVLVAAAFLIVALTVVVTTVFMRQRIKARVEGHINKLYKEINDKAITAVAAGFTDIPGAFFDLYKALKSDLGPLIELGGPMGEMVKGLRDALNRKPAFASTKHPTPDEGTSIMVMENPPLFKTENYVLPTANDDLRIAASNFHSFWQNEKHIKDLIRGTIHNLRGNEF